MPERILIMLELVEFFDNAIFQLINSSFQPVLELVEFFDNAIFICRRHGNALPLELVEFFDNAIFVAFVISSSFSAGACRVF